MSSQSGPDWSVVDTVRRNWRQVDAQIPRLRAVHGALSALSGAVSRSRPGQAKPDPVLTALDRLGGHGDDRRTALAFLTDPLFEGNATLHSAFRRGRVVTPAVDAVATALTAYPDGGDWSAVWTAVADIVEPQRGPMAIDTTALDQVVTLFELAIEAAIAAREKHAADLSKALEDVYIGSADPVEALNEQPIAMLPVRLETRFVDEDRTKQGDPTDLLVRVFPDQIHVDSHETQLTDDEVHWGQNFWATLWYARHPDPGVVSDDPEADYLEQRLPNRRLCELVADVDPGKFSDEHHRRYAELKERAWRQLLDRFGRERAAYVVHALEPTDDDLATDLLTQPPAPPDLPVPDYDVTPTVTRPGSGSGENGDSGEVPDDTVPGVDTTDPMPPGGVGDVLPEPGTGLSEGGPEDGTGSVPDAPDRFGEEHGASGTSGDDNPDGDDSAGSRGESDSGSPDDEGDTGDDGSADSPPERLPTLSFPAVPRRPSSWTQQPRAELLPDRWVAVAEWEDAAGTSHRTAVAGAPVREPLAVGPSPESVADDASASPASGRMDWMVDFDEAMAVGMGLRLNLSGLAGFDPGRGFTRLLVVGVKASLGDEETPDELVDLLDAHHYTDGLEFLETGTPTNNHDEQAGYSREDDPTESMAVECVPPLVESGDRSDGDLLARALAIDSDDDHVFANVENADATEQRDARHVHSALWPATLGYCFQDLLVDNRFADNPSLWGSDGPHGTGSRRREGFSDTMLWHDAYRRHFVRYVRGSGPFPAMRVGKQPYGVLPARATETDLDVTVVDHVQLARLQQGTISVAEFEQQGTEPADLVEAGVSPETLVAGGADPDAVLEAGADPTKVVAGAGDPVSALEASDLVPEGLLQDGTGVLSHSKVTREALDEAGVPVDELREAGVSASDLLRGRVTRERLDELGVTTGGLADAMLSERARSLGITPRALQRAGISPTTLLRGDISADHVRALGLSTRAVADAVLPGELRELGVTPRRLERAGVSPQDLLNGTVSASDLQRAGVDAETLATALLPAELRAVGVTPDRVGEAISVADLFNGDVGHEELRRAGFTTDALVEGCLPAPVREAGITPDALAVAGITPEDVLNGTVSPADLAEAGVTPEALAEAGVLPDVLSELGHAVSDLIAAGLEPAELLDGGLSVGSLLDAGATPELLVEAGLAPERLVEAGVSAAELVFGAGAPVEKLPGAGVSPADLARVGAAAADVAGVDAPADDLVQAGFTALELLDAGADALGVAEGGARPTRLREGGVDAGTLREAGRAAGSLWFAGYSAGELLDAGYTAEELLNGGYSPDDLLQAGVDPATVEGSGRPVGDLLAAGQPPAELRESGYAARQLLDAGLDAGAVAAAGYTAGELVDAGIPPADLAAAGVDVGELRAAGASIDDIAEADVDAASLGDAGAGADQLLEAGFEPAELLEAGFESVELEVAGVDVDALAEAAAAGDADAGDVAGWAREGGQYAAAVREDPNRAEADLYAFSFDPALPRSGVAGGRAGGADVGESESESGRTDGGAAASVPVVRPLSIDDRLPADLEARLAGLGSRWTRAADRLPFAGATDEAALIDALKREGVSADIRQRTMAYSGEPVPGQDRLNRLVRQNFDPPGAMKPALAPLSRGTELDPRLGHFHVTDVTADDIGSQSGAGGRSPGPLDGSSLGSPTRDSIQRHGAVGSDIDSFVADRAAADIGSESGADGSGSLEQFYRFHLGFPTQGSIQQHEMVDGDIDSFVDILLDSTLSDVTTLSSRIDTGALSLETGVLGGEQDWDSLDAGDRREQVVTGIEGADDPVAFARQLLGDSSGDAAGYEKILQLGTNQAAHGDSGVLRSLLRLLLQNGLLQEFVSARRRLGLAFDDLPGGWPDPAYYDASTEGPLGSLFDGTPAALFAHPNVEDLTDDPAGDAYASAPPVSDLAAGTGGTRYSYADALQDAAAMYTSTTSIDPRLSEFTDSLAYLKTIDPDDLSRLAMETLDLASHRIDAWWTSLATKRLFELREAQGTYDADAGFDHRKWSGGGSDVPRATLDPGLLSSLSVPVSGSSVGTTTGGTDTGASDDGSGTATRRSDTEADDGESGTGTPVPQGSTDSGATESGPSTVAGAAAPDIAQFDPATLGDVVGSSADGTGDGDTTTDGGVGPGGAESGRAGRGSEGSDSGETTPADTVATRSPLSDPSAVHDRAGAEPGLYVGGYGFVENLAADTGRDRPEYVHTPSEQHATTAAILRSGAAAHDADEGENPLSVDLSPERVRQGLRLVRRVRRGQSLGELLGYRFERRLHEETVTRGPEVDLMAYRDDLGAEFPATYGKLERPDEGGDSRTRADRELAARDAVDGYRLLKSWDDYPFGLDALPATDTAEYEALDGIVGDLEAMVDAAGDLLTAESVHQLGRGNFQRSGGSIGALARGEPLPDPAVAQPPRSETGLTHRQCVLLGPPTERSDGPRTAAEPVLASWVARLLPDGDEVECTATYRWTETTADSAAGSEAETERTVETSATLADTELGALDTLLLFGADREETRSELEQRLVYHLLRTRPEDPAVPAEASVDLHLTDTATADATSMADLIELARSVREVVQSSRPVDAEDLVHPTDRTGPGYDRETVETLTSRADRAHDRLLEVTRSLDRRIAVLDADHDRGDGLEDIPTPSSPDAGGASRPSAASGADGVTLPSSTSPDAAPSSTDGSTVTEQVTGLADSVRSAREVLPLSAAASVADAVDADTVWSELSALADRLPAGVADPFDVPEDLSVWSAPDQSFTGTLGEPVQVPDVAVDGGSSDSGADGTASDATDGDSRAGSVDIAVPSEWLQRHRSALGATESVAGTVDLQTRPEVDLTDRRWYASETDLPTVVKPGDASGESGDGPTAASADEQNPEGGQSGQSPEGDGGASERQKQSPDWSESTATVRLWGTDGLSWFEKETTTTPSAGGRFRVGFDFSDVPPGTTFRVVVEVDGTVAYSTTGRVVADDESPDDEESVGDACGTLGELLWLRKHRDILSVESGPSAALAAGLDVTDWEAVRAEREAVDSAPGTVGESDLDAMDDLLAAERLDPAALADAVDTAVGPVDRLGLDSLAAVTGDGDASGAVEWYTSVAGVGDIRARIERTLENPAPFNAGVAPRLLGYHHDAAATLSEMEAGEAVAAYLDAFLAQPAWVVRYLDRQVAEPAALVRDLTAWLYSPDEVSDTSRLAGHLRTLAGTISDLPALAALFEDTPTDREPLVAFESHLGDLADALESGPSTAGDAGSARSSFEADIGTAASSLGRHAADERAVLSSVPDDVERAFRNAVLEQLRQPMTVAASYGIYGSTPRSPDGGRPDDERELLEQAEAVLQRLRSRLTAAAALDPRIEPSLADRPVPQRVEDGVDRLETLFGDGFTVLPPFEPSNPEELTATFTDDGLIPDERGMAAETWLQRAASSRERIADFSQARSYAEAVTGTLTPALTVGQVPFEADDTWVGVDGVEPSPGRVSLVAQFGPDVSPAAAGTRTTGLFVDEWTEGVPGDTETTGVALNYDDPGSHAPQSVLVATPSGDSWSLEELVSVVAETAEYTRRRAVDLGDLDDIVTLFPGLYFAVQSDPEPATPTVDFRMLDWYDREPIADLLPPGLSRAPTEYTDFDFDSGGSI